MCESVGASRSVGHCGHVCGRDIASPPRVSGCGAFRVRKCESGNVILFRGRVRMRARRALGFGSSGKFEKACQNPLTGGKCGDSIKTT